MSRPRFALVAAAALGLFAGAQTPATVHIGLFGPDNLGFDAAGQVYLIDTDHAARSRILKLTPDGKVLADWRVFSAAPGRNNGPNDIALGPSGNVYVNDAGTGSLLKILPTGVAAVFAASVPPPAHVTVARGGDLYLAEAPANRILKLSASGRLLAAWHRARGKASNQWNQPQTVSTLSSGDILVDDWGNDRIEILSPAGATLRIFRAAGEPDGPLVSNSGVFVDTHDHIWVADYQHPRVKELSASGRLLRVVANTPGDTIFEHTPSSIAVDSAGNIYCADGAQSVVKFTASGRVLARWR
ncbi:MAG: NHL repeat-containing protein [Terriglobales bacterium]